MELKETSIKQLSPRLAAEPSPRTYLTQNEIASLLEISPQAASIYAGKLELKPYRQQNKSAYSPSAVRKFLTARGFISPKEVIAFQMLKGSSTIQCFQSCDPFKPIRRESSLCRSRHAREFI